MTPVERKARRKHAPLLFRNTQTLHKALSRLQQTKQIAYLDACIVRNEIVTTYEKLREATEIQ